MRNRFDHLAKQIGKAALGASGITVAHDEITPETMYADLRHEPIRRARPSVRVSDSWGGSRRSSVSSRFTVTRSTPRSFVRAWRSTSLSGRAVGAASGRSR
jgi:hypothetical protein